LASNNGSTPGFGTKDGSRTSEKAWTLACVCWVVPCIPLLGTIPNREEQGGIKFEPVSARVCFNAVVRGVTPNKKQHPQF